MQANEAQAMAVMHPRGPCLVLAGPGSGKTFVITKRILYLLEHGAPPESILVITFTKEAALSMQRRFQEMSEMTYPVNFGTFHSVFYHILKKSNALKSNQLLNNSEKKNLLLPILKSYGQQSQQEDSQSGLQEDVIQVLAAISFYKNTMQSDAARNKAPIRWQPCFEDIFHTYERDVEKTGRLDFDDMLYGCKKLLQENPGIRAYWQKRFNNILIDEFQDINPVQYEVVKLLAAEPYNIFAVGDDDQSIYGFRGSEPDCMKRFASEFHARQLLLDMNYRSKAEIVNASLAVIGENKNRFVKKLRAAGETDPISAKANSCIAGGGQNSNKTDYEIGSDLSRVEDIGLEGASGKAENVRLGNDSGRMESVKFGMGLGRMESVGSGGIAGNKYPVTLQPFTDKEGQYGYLLQEISAILQADSHADTPINTNCAVLFRTNASMQGFAARLKSADIPYVMRERVSSIYEHFIVADIMAYLQIAAGKGKREQMLRIMNRPSRYISREAVKEGSVDIRKMREYYEQAQLPERQKFDVKCALQRFEKQLQSISRLSPLPALNYILKAAGYEQYLKELTRSKPEKRQEYLELLEWLKEDAARFATYREWQDFQEEYAKTLEQGKGRASGQFPAKKERTDRNGVQLLTVHGAKGLEFDRVWIPDCNEKVFPYGAMPDEKTVEEERRIFYVAMTRAKKSLELLYLTGTKERPRQPSRFLNPLFHSSVSSSNSQLSRYSSKASATFSYSSSSSI